MNKSMFLNWPPPAWKFQISPIGQSLSSGNKCFELLERRNRGTGTGFGIETVGTAGFGVEQPIIGRDVIVGTAHFHASVARNLGLFCRGGRNDGLRPVSFFFDIEIGLFAIGRRRIVAAVEPD